MTGVLLATLGASVGATVEMFNDTITDIRPAPTTCTATLTFNANGKQQQTENASTTDVGTYVVPTAQTTFYEVMVHKESGTALTSGTLDTWIHCNTSPAWTYTTSGINKRGFFTASIRLIGTTTTLDSTSVGGIEMEVEATP